MDFKEHYPILRCIPVSEKTILRCIPVSEKTILRRSLVFHKQAALPQIFYKGFNNFVNSKIGNNIQ